jgi:hypothetical protein
MPRAFAAFALLTTAAVSAAASPYRFDAPEVLDLTEPQRLAPLQGQRVPTIAGAVDARTTAAELLRPSGIETPAGNVRRDGKRLTIGTQAEPAVRFENWSNANDGERFLHSGLVGGYHRVEVQFDHDAPGSFLVNPRNGRTAFVHDGGDVVAFSPKGTRLASLHTMNAPHLLAIASLGDEGPRLELQCRDEKDGVRKIAFRGWQDENHLLIEVDDVPLLLAHKQRNWTAQSPMSRAGYACWVSLPPSTQAGVRR